MYRRAIACFLALIAAGAQRVVQATSYSCPPLPVRLFDATAVVVGQTIAVESREPRPGRVVRTYRFRIDELLKGDAFRAGDVFSEESRAHFGFATTFLPPQSPDRSIIVLMRGADGKLHSTPCGRFAEAQRDEIVRMLRVLDAPQTYLESDNAIEVSALLAWIQRRYFVPDNPREEISDAGVNSPIPRAAAIAYVQRHAGHADRELRSRAVQLLAAFHPPEAFEPLAAALNAGLASRDHSLIQLAAEGLGNLDDPRVVDTLIASLRTLRAARGKLVEVQEPAWTLEGEQYTKTVQRPDDLPGTAGAVIAALGRFREARIVDELLEMDEQHESARCRVLAQIGDARAVEPLLAAAWRGSAPAVDALVSFDDPRIAEQALARLYDDPHAPRILADRGDPGAREFMLRLIQQGHWLGAHWAGAAGDRSLAPELVRMLREEHRLNVAELAQTLGRLRAFDAIPLLEKVRMETHPAALAMMYLCGLADLTERDEQNRMRDLIGALRTRLAEMAARESWNAADRAAVDALLVRVAADWGKQPPFYHDDDDVWTPPAALRDMPDPLNAPAIADYVGREWPHCRAVLQTGTSADKVILLHAIRRAARPPGGQRAPNPGRLLLLLARNTDLLVPLLTDESWQVRAAVRVELQDPDVTLTVEQLAGWAKAGDWASAKSALAYVRTHPRPEYAPTVVDVFRAARHLFEDELFQAIIATRAVGCIEGLRGYLEREHIDLRRNAAVALAHLGDAVGLAVLEQEWRRVAGQTYAPQRREVREALALLGRTVE